VWGFSRLVFESRCNPFEDGQTGDCKEASKADSIQQTLLKGIQEAFTSIQKEVRRLEKRRLS